MNLISIKKHYFPEKDKIRDYHRLRKSGTRIILVSKAYGKFIYRPEWQTSFGMSSGQWRMVNHDFGFTGYANLTDVEYSELEKSVIAYCWHGNGMDFIKAAKQSTNEV